MGCTRAPRSNAPRLNITVYSLFTHVPSGKMSSGLRAPSATCSRSLRATASRSAASVRLNQMQPREESTWVCRKPTHPECFCMMTAKAVSCSRTMKSIIDVWLATKTWLARGLGRGPWYRTTPVHDATNTPHMNSTSHASAPLRALPRRKVCARKKSRRKRTKPPTSRMSLKGKRRRYRMARPQHQNGKRYHVQFHGTGLVLVKHLVKESSMIAETQSLTASDTSRSSRSFAEEHDESVACDPALRLSCSSSSDVRSASSMSRARCSRSWAVSRTSEKRRLCEVDPLMPASSAPRRARKSRWWWWLSTPSSPGQLWSRGRGSFIRD
mmetsp:Transcript_10115/g.32765  ORF Transcript_10115/g.32765 Transcript_10115/m.32765 type:complete len:326 (+) Transcript_10115:304-1281(+)